MADGEVGRVWVAVGAKIDDNQIDKAIDDIGDAFRDAGEEIERSFGDAGDALVEALEPAEASIDDMTDAAEGFRKEMDLAGQSAERAWNGADRGSRKFAGGLRDVGQTIQNIVFSLSMVPGLMDENTKAMAGWALMGINVGVGAMQALNAVTDLREGFQALKITVSELKLGEMLTTGLGPLAIEIAAVAAAVALLYLAWTQNWGDIQGKTADASNFIQARLAEMQTAIGKVVDGLNDVAGAAYEGFTEGFSGADDAAEKVDLLGDALERVGEVGDYAGEVFDFIAKSIGMFAEAASEVVSTNVAAFFEALGAAAKYLSDLLDRLLNSIFGVRDGMAQLGSYMQPIVDLFGAVMPENIRKVNDALDAYNQKIQTNANQYSEAAGPARPGATPGTPGTYTPGTYTPGTGGTPGTYTTTPTAPTAREQYKEPLEMRPGWEIVGYKDGKPVYYNEDSGGQTPGFGANDTTLGDTYGYGIYGFKDPNQTSGVQEQIGMGKVEGGRTWEMLFAEGIWKEVTDAIEKVGETQAETAQDTQKQVTDTTAEMSDQSVNAAQDMSQGVTESLDQLGTEGVASVQSAVSAMLAAFAQLGSGVPTTGTPGTGSPGTPSPCGTTPCPTPGTSESAAGGRIGASGYSIVLNNATFNREADIDAMLRAAERSRQRARVMGG